MNQESRIMKHGFGLMIAAAMFLFVGATPVRAQFVCCSATGGVLATYDSEGACIDAPCGEDCFTPEECEDVAAAHESRPSASRAPTASTEVALPNPLGETDIRVIIAKVIQAITGIAGSIALLVFVWGGFQWLTSGGNPEKIKKGRDILIWSALGLLIMFGSYLIVRYILTAITAAT